MIHSQSLTFKQIPCNEDQRDNDRDDEPEVCVVVNLEFLADEQLKQTEAILHLIFSLFHSGHVITPSKLNVSIEILAGEACGFKRQRLR